MRMHVISRLSHAEIISELNLCHLCLTFLCSHVVCQIIEAADVIHPLVNILKRAEISEDVMEKVLYSFFFPSKFSDDV